jgi:hypothetical protein
MITDAASTPTYKEKHMAIGTMQGGLYYDANRDTYYSERERFEREMQQRQMYAAQQQMGQNPYGKAIAGGNHAEQQRQVAVVDPKDPLSFLSKADNKLLLTGEAP